MFLKDMWCISSNAMENYGARVSNVRVLLYVLCFLLLQSRRRFLSPVEMISTWQVLSIFHGLFFNFSLTAIFFTEGGGGEWENRAGLLALYYCYIFALCWTSVDSELSRGKTNGQGPPLFLSSFFSECKTKWEMISYQKTSNTSLKKEDVFSCLSRDHFSACSF